MCVIFSWSPNIQWYRFLTFVLNIWHVRVCFCNCVICCLGFNNIFGWKSGCSFKYFTLPHILHSTDSKLAHMVSSPLHSPWCCNYNATVLQLCLSESRAHCTVPGSGSLRCHVVKKGSLLVLVFSSVLTFLHTREQRGKKIRGLFNSGWNCDDSEVVWINGVDMSGQGGEMETCVFMHVYMMCMMCVYMCDLLPQLVSGQV